MGGVPAVTLAHPLEPWLGTDLPSRVFIHSNEQSSSSNSQTSSVCLLIHDHHTHIHTYKTTSTTSKVHLLTSARLIYTKPPTKKTKNTSKHTQPCPSSLEKLSK